MILDQPRGVDVRGYLGSRFLLITGPLFGPVLVEHSLGGDGIPATWWGKERSERLTAMTGSRWIRD